MKRRSINPNDSSFVGGNASASMDFEMDAHNNDTAGWCRMIGCGGDGGGGTGGDNSVATDMVVSSSSVGNGVHGPTTDIFLNQTSYVSSGRRRRNNSNKAKRSTKNKKSSAAGADNISNNPNDKHSDLSSLIASELTKLSIEDRDKALEEVHGVVENTEEDPEEMETLYFQVKEELKRIRYKQAYEKAAFLTNSYVTDPEFVLPFLRADNYNPRSAAIRLAEYFKYKLELFGEHTLVRDIMYDDLSDDDKAVLHSGFVQSLPASDRAGRHVIVCNMDELLKTGTMMNMIRAMWYLSVRNIQMHTAMSKMGIVGVYFTHGMCNIFEKLSRDQSNATGFMGNALPYKFASVHFCSEKRNAFGMGIQTMLMMSLGKYARIRLRSHCGSRLECTYALKSYGIDLDSLSDSVQGMIQCCRLLDELYRKKQDARLLPRPNDILLGRGRPFQLFPGNLALTATIDQYRKRYASSKKMDKKIITIEIVENILKSGGCFLKKANTDLHSNIDWEEVDFETARLKVSHSFRTMTKYHPGHDDAWNQGSQQQQQLRGSEEGVAMSDESIQSIVAEETRFLGMIAESTPSSSDAQKSSINVASSNKKRKGDDIF